MTAPGAPAAAGSDKSTLFGVLGLVLGFICCGIVGIVFGVLSINQAKQYGSSQTIGKVALILGIVWTVLQILGAAVQLA